MYRRKGRLYELGEDYSCNTEITGWSVNSRDNTVCLGLDGRIHLDQYYTWDGPSGIAIDTMDFMIPSAVHDALYRLIRESALPKSLKPKADKLLYNMCLSWGMGRFRAWYVYQAVKLFGRYFIG